jgi:hypothetical protein
MKNELGDNRGQIHSDEFIEIMSQSPSWIVRYGIIIISMLICSLFIISWHIHYTELVSAPVTIISSNPTNSIKKIAASLSSNNASKIKIGQRAVIKLSDFQTSEHEVLEGKVKLIKFFSEEEIYYIEIELTKITSTTIGKYLSRSKEINGMVEIIIEDLRLFEKLTAPITSIYKTEGH